MSEPIERGRAAFACPPSWRCGTGHRVTAPSASAQVLYGSIVGNVKDAQGATIPGATVTITNKENGLTRDAITTEDGGLQPRQRAARAYDVKVVAAGLPRVRQRTDVPVSASARSAAST